MSETVSHSGLRILQQRSEPGSSVNEDLCGSRGGVAWMIDGATGVAAGQRTPGPSDAAWLAQAIDRQLAVAASGPKQDLAVLIGSLEAGISNDFARLEAFKTASPDLLGPAACLGLLALDEGGHRGPVLRGLFLGDVAALVPTPEGIIRWTDERAKPFEGRTIAAMGSHQPGTGALPEAARLQIIENRRKLNQPGGYWVVQPERPWAGHELTFSAAVGPGRPVVLATDGFMRLVDVFDDFDDASLYAALASGEGSVLIDRLRALERGSVGEQARPRVKKHDDATFMVLEVGI